MKKFIKTKTLLLITIGIQFVLSCNSSHNKNEIQFDLLTEEERRLPENALAGITVSEGLEAKLFASEPVLTNPTNIDIDHRGRVWVCEAFNYRPAITGNEIKEEGDRILILEDTNGDGMQDKSTVFYQGPEINSPLGIWVMGNQAIVSQSPYVWLFTDTDGDDKADTKEVIFQGISGEQHDHGMHAFVFGPDGKFYFNFGNEGGQLIDRNGEIVKDVDGKEISPENYKQGLVFRSDTDFTNIEVLGQNFRNNYEVAVDSYGTLWQSDNDDDGNKGVRINFVMEYGNYGYRDEMTGAGWRANRTNMEAEIPLQHWHLNDPGVVPNLLQTGAGSPTGILVYEGRLLPEVFWDQMIHTDAGPNVVRAYPVTKDGAGYKAEIVDIMKGDRNQWFRPSDVAVAPDGSLMIADWYDPGVGGHQVGDLNRGRIFRIAPPKTPYKLPDYDLKTMNGALEALQNPNLSWRYQAWQALHTMGSNAEKGLLEIFENHENPRIRARALWLLAKMEGKGMRYVEKAIKDENPDIRITGLRAGRQLKLDLIPYLQLLVKDKDPQVRRESAIALRHNSSPEAAALWTKLALQHDGNDRWYLEALGIGADGQWDSYFANWAEEVKNKAMANTSNRDIIWRARTGKSIPMLAALASESSEDIDQRLRYFRAFDFNPDAEAKSKALITMLDTDKNQPNQMNKLVLTHLDPAFTRKSNVAMASLKGVLNDLEGTQEFVEMVQRFEVKEENPRLLKLTLANSDNAIGRSAANTLLRQGGVGLVNQVLSGKDEKQIFEMLQAIKGVGSKESIQILETLTFNENRPLTVRREAAGSIGGSYDGEGKVLELLKADKFPENLKAAAVSGVSNAWRKSVRIEAAAYLESTDEESKMPPINELIAMEGNVDNGLTIFKRNCAVCHQVNEIGMDFGPKLSEIGSKLPKEAQYLSILHPDAGISFGYEGFMVKMKDGSTLGGIISSRTETDVDLKMPGGSVTPLKTSDIESITQMGNSMMPSGLEKTMSSQELVDLVEYLMTLKSK
ncbi:PVC-type heme-binding CxxCH protein [Algoriphagus persicinus]|uniref:PVC-type heme-binding CxxCH protein n=1 Tax=Algoriphagus persicinus TaxID=3108754 RepID=UPI002B3982BD|nr:PVC-type heme-binding CxxCH protein [Algoriphagus sp. E1-3-M2]MEB2787315.1 PVC-type heme-binding CxxCH protein [Algoriphagus sp. E1-3-M2]